MNWQVELTIKAKKQAEKLPKRIIPALIQLMLTSENQGLFEATGRITAKSSLENTTATRKKGIQPMWPFGEKMPSKSDWWR